MSNRKYNVIMEELKKYLLEADVVITHIQVMLGDEKIITPYETELIMARDVIMMLRGFVDCLCGKSLEHVE